MKNYAIIKFLMMFDLLCKRKNRMYIYPFIFKLDGYKPWAILVSILSVSEDLHVTNLFLIHTLMETHSNPLLQANKILELKAFKNF